MHVLTNTVIIAVMATVMAILIGFTLAWILTRTNVPGRDKLERLMELPYYMTPLVGALAWAVLASPKSGFFNQIWQLVGRLAATCSTSTRCSASPGSWRCSRARSPSS